MISCGPCANVDSLQTARYLGCYCQWDQSSIPSRPVPSASALALVSISSHITLLIYPRSAYHVSSGVTTSIVVIVTISFCELKCGNRAHEAACVTARVENSPLPRCRPRYCHDTLSKPRPTFLPLSPFPLPNSRRLRHLWHHLAHLERPLVIVYSPARSKRGTSATRIDIPTSLRCVQSLCHLATPRSPAHVCSFPPGTVRIFARPVASMFVERMLQYFFQTLLPAFRHLRQATASSLAGAARPRGQPALPLFWPPGFREPQLAAPRPAIPRDSSSFRVPSNPYSGAEPASLQALPAPSRPVFLGPGWGSGL